MSTSNIEVVRAWMYNHRDPITAEVTTEFKAGLTSFMEFAANQPIALQSGMISCPCAKCKNSAFLDIYKVGKHLYDRGFTPCYYYWYSHGEYSDSVGSSSGVDPLNMVARRRRRRKLPEPEIPEQINVGMENVGTVGMVAEAFRDVGTYNMEEDRREEPNPEARKFFDMLDAARNPIYVGCKEGHSPLSAATRMMTIKTDNNLSEDCVDQIADFFKEYLPEGNSAPGSYYEIEQLVSGLGLPYHVIDVCIDNCMLFWDKDAERTKCKFCTKPRYQDTQGRVKVPYKRMWYLPLADRLKRLYQSDQTARAMKWHKKHVPGEEICHPSEAKAWKHFQALHPIFSEEDRNVYLGLCTDGFSPFGKCGRPYSLWPVIVTPYNLPPALCMKREYLFLTVLVPGPKNPKRSFDVFLQPLIKELKELWYDGVAAYDVSKSENFRMRAVLMWTISDFPAYGMLSGWTTQGKLACPYCQDNTDSIQLQHYRKTSWFDCHRRFLEHDHPYRRSRRLFRKRRVVLEGAPPEIDGQALLTQLREFDAERTPDVGGNAKFNPYGYGLNHNWHKKSIFWDLPYWKDHLLRHNLDVMHIEKNFFDNIMNTVLNVAGKSKDNLKSRLDLPDWCCRELLHANADGTARVPTFRLEGDERTEFFEWIKYSVNYPDGYASNLAHCVDSHGGRLSNMKSHDCHVFMQRLLPMAFTHLLQEDVHEAIAGVGAFF